jgi:hypothetical protein
MPWTGDQTPWYVSFSKPLRPSGQYEALNYFPGNPVLCRGKGGSKLPLQILRFFPGGPVLCRGRGASSLARQMVRNLPGGPVIPGIGLKPYYPNRTVLRYQYNASVLPGLGPLMTALGLKGR